jgi:hypothetical protein
MARSPAEKLRKLGGFCSRLICEWQRLGRKEPPGASNYYQTTNEGQAHPGAGKLANPGRAIDKLATFVIGSQEAENQSDRTTKHTKNTKKDRREMDGGDTS